MTVETFTDEEYAIWEHGDPGACYDTKASTDDDTQRGKPAPGAFAPGPREPIPFEISDRVQGTDIIPDEVLLKCPEYDPDKTCATGGVCPFDGNENACSDGAK